MHCECNEDNYVLLALNNGKLYVVQMARGYNTLHLLISLYRLQMATFTLV